MAGNTSLNKGAGARLAVADAVLDVRTLTPAAHTRMLMHCRSLLKCLSGSSRAMGRSRRARSMRDICISCVSLILVSLILMLLCFHVSRMLVFMLIDGARVVSETDAHLIRRIVFVCANLRSIERL